MEASDLNDIDNDYDYYIAKAARAYIYAYRLHEKERTSDTYYNVYNKLIPLRQMIVAEENSWNPSIYWDELTQRDTLGENHER